MTRSLSSQKAKHGRAALTAELKRFTDRFGRENGAKWFSEGKSYVEALELHSDVLSEQVAERDRKLAEVNHFEFKLGSRLGRVAAGLNMPK